MLESAVQARTRFSLKRYSNDRFASGTSLSQGKGDWIDIARVLGNDNRERVSLRV